MLAIIMPAVWHKHTHIDNFDIFLQWIPKCFGNSRARSCTKLWILLNFIFSLISQLKNRFKENSAHAPKHTRSLTWWKCVPFLRVFNWCNQGHGLFRFYLKENIRLHILPVFHWIHYMANLICVFVLLCIFFWMEPVWRNVPARKN